MLLRGLGWAGLGWAACGAWPGAERRAFRAGMVAAAGWAGSDSFFACGAVARRCAPGVPGGRGRCGRVGRVRLVLPAALWPGAVRRAFRARMVASAGWAGCGLFLPAALWPGAARRAFWASMVAAAGWAGARLSGSRASEARPERPVFRGLRGFDSLRALATGPRLTTVVGGPGASARNDPIRLRSEPLPTLPFDAFAFGRGGVSRPFEGLDSFGAVRTLRTRSSPASRADAMRPRID